MVPRGVVEAMFVGDDPDVRRARDDLLEAVRAPLTRAFRSSFLLSAAFALLAGLVAPAFRGRAG